MSIFDKIRERLDRRNDWSDPSVSVHAGGFDVAGLSVAWTEIQEISAHKIDLTTTDEVRFVIDLDSGTSVTVSEEQHGFGQLVSALEAQFAGVVGWQAKVIQPAFAPNHSLLYRRT